jgi:transcriptional regulator with XRE-family HTH domain
MSVGQRIAELRNERKISQNQLAAAMGVSRQAVSKWENGQSTPDAMNLIRLADVLNSDVEYLTTGRAVVPTRPPVVIKSVETVEKIVEKPVIQVVEKVVEREVPVPVEVPVVEYVEKPVVKRILRIRYRRDPLEYLLVALAAFLIGLLTGFLL